MPDKQPHHLVPRTLDQVLDEIVYDRDALEVYFVAERRQACMGAGGALGHPKVFYTIGDKGYVECGYCDRIYVLDPARAGQVMRGGDETPSEEIERDRQQTTRELPGDGLTERAVPPPGENLEFGHDTVSSPKPR